MQSRKKPPAPSLTRRRKQQDVVAQIAAEIIKVVERYEEVLAIIGSWRDTLDDCDILQLMRKYNASRPILHRPQ